ncbi:MAG: Thiosulfate sulfurtransferase PspE [Owenweeksia sp. TMED14]|nr:MAG: Thiosulfate sulfurtransferase PspE [Owenweeksia sp. TMED14]|tara:strand:- start:3451 stop:3729 length:279 start_codon:yes stop_codon:yes gene_type:complete
MNIEEAINHPNATILDVRREEEFNEGNVLGSINIPLHEVPDNIDNIKSMSKPIVLYCKSGGRSGQALIFLQSQGLKELQNGGGFDDVMKLKS